ncbi:type II toxin-antitoxin system VapC family toxin [Fodinibius sp.]|uniref:type II toxin-antitoxin system VapC family toxin n=1 Tax=Fodinibius sp. TaxID=1872440 RepID=UPI002ACEC714|nr:PIN domain-containing protein [Fodinibius sp.]MDZ7659442.1 PIN domain-containing protein [Fodinibius sp.]
MAQRAKAYVDTAAFIAFADRSDSHHHQFCRLFADPPTLITSTAVVSEGHGWFLKRYDRFRALQFLQMIEEMDFLDVLAVGQEEVSHAAGYLRKFDDQSLTLVDALGLHIMKRHRIRSCWSTDRHLGLTGAALVIHAH